MRCEVWGSVTEGWQESASLPVPTFVLNSIAPQMPTYAGPPPPHTPATMPFPPSLS